MSTLVNIVLSIVLQILSYGTQQPKEANAYIQATKQVCEKPYYKIKDIKSAYVITEKEVQQSLLGINVKVISPN